MNNNEAIKKRMDELTEELNKYRKLYYDEDISEIYDDDYDEKKLELIQLELENPELVSADSPTQKVGGSVKNEFKKVKHDVPVISLKDVFSKEEVVKFINDMIDIFGEDIEFVVEVKIDGLTLVLRFRNGKLEDGITRGDGTIGESVLENAKQIKSIPHKLKSNFPYIEVRGETYMSYENFEIVNEKQAELGKKEFANPRNLAGGTLRQLDPQAVKERNLDIFIFNLEISEGIDFKTHSETLEWIKSQGFTVSPDFKVCKGAEEVWSAIESIGKKRWDLPFPIDGAVVKVNNLEYRKKLGFTNKVPRWAVAYKYPPEEKETIVLDIIEQVGRTGRITPKAILKPVQLAGTKVQHATLKNQDEINRLGVGIGDTVVIRKAGDIIPDVARVIVEKRPLDTKTYAMSGTCPICGEKTVREPDGVDIRCVNKDCSARNIRGLQYFASKDAMDISGLGKKSVEALVNEKYISNVADIYMLKNHKEELIEKGIVGKAKGVNNLLNAIEKSKDNDVERLLAGFGIRNVALSTAKTIFKTFKSIDELANAPYEQLVTISDVGEKTASEIITFFSNDETKSLIEKLKTEGLKMESKGESQVDKKLEGKIIVATGTLSKYGRSEIKEVIEAHGGKSSGSVSKKTDYVLAGENAGSKLTKAEELGIKIITEEEFEKMIK